MSFIFGMVVGAIILLVGIFLGAALYVASKTRMERMNHVCNDGLTFDNETLKKVYDGLVAAGMTQKWAGDAIDELQKRGILFREAVKN